MIIFVRGVIARLICYERMSQLLREEWYIPQLVEINDPVVACRLFLVHVWMQRDINRDSRVECHRGEVLIEEGLEHDNLVPRFQECHKDGVLSCSQ